MREQKLYADEKGENKTMQVMPDDAVDDGDDRCKGETKNPGDNGDENKD